MTGPDDDILRDVVRQAYAAEHEPSDIDVAAGLRDLVRRGRVLPTGQREWFVVLARMVFDPRDDPFRPLARVVHPRVALARRLVVLGLVTARDLDWVEHGPAER